MWCPHLSFLLNLHKTKANTRTYGVRPSPLVVFFSSLDRSKLTRQVRAAARPRDRQRLPHGDLEFQLLLSEGADTWSRSGEEEFGVEGGRLFFCWGGRPAGNLCKPKKKMPSTKYDPPRICIEYITYVAKWGPKSVLRNTQMHQFQGAIEEPRKKQAPKVSASWREPRSGGRAHHEDEYLLLKVLELWHNLLINIAQFQT